MVVKNATHKLLLRLQPLAERPTIVGIAHGFSGGMTFRKEWLRVFNHLAALPRGSRVGIEFGPRELAATLQAGEKEIGKMDPQALALIPRLAIARDLLSSEKDLLERAAVAAHFLGHNVVPLETDAAQKRFDKSLISITIGGKEKPATAKNRKIHLYSRLRSIVIGRNFLRKVVQLGIMGDAHAKDLQPVLRPHFNISRSRIRLPTEALELSDPELNRRLDKHTKTQIDATLRKMGWKR